MTTTRVVCVLLALLVAGCSSSAPQPTDRETGLPILADLPPFPGSAGALDWEETSEPADGLGAGDTTHRSIGELVAAVRALAAEAGAEVNIGFLGRPSAQEATLVIHTGSRDEAVAGDELVAEVRRNERGWYLERIRYRHHCRRGIDEQTGGCG